MNSLFTAKSEVSLGAHQQENGHRGGTHNRVLFGYKDGEAVMLREMEEEGLNIISIIWPQKDKNQQKNINQ